MRTGRMPCMASTVGWVTQETDYLSTLKPNTLIFKTCWRILPSYMFPAAAASTVTNKLTVIEEFYTLLNVVDSAECFVAASVFCDVVPDICAVQYVAVLAAVLQISYT